MTQGRGKVEFEDLVIGAGAVATREHEARVEWVMTLRRGDPVAASLPGEETWIDLRRRHAIAGLRYGIEGMRVGGVRRVVIPPHLAYGEGVPPADGVLPGALLLCQVTLLDLRPSRPSRREARP